MLNFWKNLLIETFSSLEKKMRIREKKEPVILVNINSWFGIRVTYKKG